MRIISTTKTKFRSTEQNTSFVVVKQTRSRRAGLLSGGKLQRRERMGETADGFVSEGLT
jgi:hypothetical protein